MATKPTTGTDQDRAAMGERVRYALSRAENQHAIAAQCGVSDQAVYGWKSTGRVDKRNLPVIAKHGRVNLEWLITGDGARDTDGAAASASEVINEALGVYVAERQAVALLALLAERTDRVDDLVREDVLRLMWRYLASPATRGPMGAAIAALMGEEPPDLS